MVLIYYINFYKVTKQLNADKIELKLNYYYMIIIIMNSIKVTLTINMDEYPLLELIKKNKVEDTLYQLLKTGYMIHFPTLKEIEHQADSHILIEKINHMNNKIDTSQELYQNTMTKLIGISSNSNKKGNFAENMLEDYCNKNFGDIIFERKSGVAHSGDAWLHLPNKKIIMLESKNYTTTINKDEVNKMKSDMINHHIKWGIFVSFNSMIQGMKEFDFYTFHHNNELYSIIMISNLANDVNRLDMAIQISRKLMNQIEDLPKFPWIVEDITKTLYELNEISKKNYSIRDAYHNFESEISKQSTKFYMILREYQLDIEMKITQLIKKIESTMNNAIENKPNVQRYDIISYYLNDNKKLSILSQIVDITDKKNWVILNDDINLWSIMDNTNRIGTLKVQTKKIILTLDTNDITIVFHNDMDVQIKKNLKIFKSL